MSLIIDASQPCGAKAQALAVAGVRTVIRYYSRDTLSTSKRLTAREAAQLVGAGLRIGAVHEQKRGDLISSFDAASGAADGAYARDYAAKTIRQPAGTTIWFAVDLDVEEDQITSRILPYFRSIAAALVSHGDQPGYVVGVYGSGATCAAVLDAGLAVRAWLSQSTGWRGYEAFRASGRWTLLQAKRATVAGIDCDPDEAGGAADIGDFTLPSPLRLASATASPMIVNARSGLRLRGGPGVEFDIARTLAPGTPVQAMKTVNGWTMVDLAGDGIADGFVSAAFLKDAPVDRAVHVGATALEHATDAAHIAALIAEGSTPDGLAAARIAAKTAWDGYPTNGCAAHLSALLQHAGIDVPMTLGAGKLAHVLLDRGWSKITVGDQMPGDVGVCYDNDPTPAGADHIYLVVKTLGRDEMLIADNQRTKDELHNRFATGHGKTPTEYFLRAT